MRGIPTKSFPCLALSLVLAILAETPIRAQHAASSESDRWTSHISPYVWFVSLDGEAAATASTTPHTRDSNWNLSNHSSARSKNSLVSYTLLNA